MKQGGDADGNDDEARCVKEEDTEGDAPGTAVGHRMMNEEGDDRGNDDDAARCPPHPEFVLGLCYRCGATEEDAGGSASGVTVSNIDDAPATSIAIASDMATLKRERKLILVLDLDHTLLNSTRLHQDLSALEQRNGFTPDTEDELHMELFRLEYSDNVRMLTKLRPFVRGFLEQASSRFEMHVYTLGRPRLRQGGHRPSRPGRRLLPRQGCVQKGVDPAGREEPRRHPGRRSTPPRW